MHKESYNFNEKESGSRIFEEPEIILTSKSIEQ